MAIDQIAHGEAERPFVAAGPVDVPRKTIELGAVAPGIARVIWIGRYAHRLKPIGAAIENVPHAGDRLDVIDDRRLAEGPFDCRKRRLDPRPGPLPFEALDQPR